MKTRSEFVTLCETLNFFQITEHRGVCENTNSHQLTAKSKTTQERVNLHEVVSNKLNLCKFLSIPIFREICFKYKQLSIKCFHPEMKNNNLKKKKIKVELIDLVG